VANSTVVGIDPTAVADWLEQLGIPFTGPLSFERIGLGQSNLTYLVGDAQERKWVLRRAPRGELLASAHDVAREARILSALEDTPVPTPRVYGLTRDAAGVPLLLMEFVDGLVVDRMPIAESLTPQRRREIGLSMPTTLAEIHAVDIEKSGLDDLASHKPYALPARRPGNGSTRWYARPAKWRRMRVSESMGDADGHRRTGDRRGSSRAGAGAARPARPGKQ
jgi:aminoglycoside phosphotransferase (APT) family kinase protein